MSDKRYIQSINILSNTNSMWRNSNRNMDSNRCMRKSDCICIKNDNSKPGCIASDDSTGKHNSSMRWEKRSEEKKIKHWITRSNSKKRHIQSINIECIASKWMWMNRKKKK